MKTRTCFIPIAVQLLSRAWLLVTPWTAARQASLSITNSRSLLNSCPLSWWYHPTILSSVTLFSSCPQSFPALRSFPMSQLLASGGQSIGGWALASVLPGNIQGWFPLGLTDLISLLSKGLSRLFSNTTVQSINLRGSAFFIVQLSHPYMTTGKTIALIRWTFVGKLMSLLFNMLSRLVITFLTRSKHLLILWLQSPSAVILELQKIKSATSENMKQLIFSYIANESLMWCIANQNNYYSFF